MNDWRIEAECASVGDPDIFFDPDAYDIALEYCSICKVRMQCLAEGIRQDGIELYGIWGGLMPEERAKFRNEKFTVLIQRKEKHSA